MGDRNRLGHGCDVEEVEDGRTRGMMSQQVFLQHCIRGYDRVEVNQAPVMYCTVEAR